MTTEGTVRLWRNDDGWGVIDTDQTPGGCWTHFGSVHIAGYRTLHAGQAVLVDWEPADQDGYAFQDRPDVARRRAARRADPLDR